MSNSCKLADERLCLVFIIDVLQNSSVCVAGVIGIRLKTHAAALAIRLIILFMPYI